MGIKYSTLFNSVYNGRRVLITGHTGFKGSWLVALLKLLGANIAGYALKPDTDPSHFYLIQPDITSVFNDINDYNELNTLIESFRPEIVFHLAAQPIVLESYKNPLYTFRTNVMGTANILECCRQIESVKSIVVVTTDKVYQNDNRVSGYTEEDRLAGHDPYSASKVGAEIVAESYRKSFFNNGTTLLATARAGNVIGGGDWAADRLIPDLIRAHFAGQKPVIRNPESVRPWQHVLESLTGYLVLGWYLAEGRTDFADSWNFGPEPSGCLSVSDLVVLSGIDADFTGKVQNVKKFHESGILKLDSSRALKKLGWQPVWDIDKATSRTINWYRNFYENKSIMTYNDISDYLEDAIDMDVIWTR